MITFLYSTGCRISEALALNRCDVIHDQVVVFGKGRKERTVSINDVARYYLNLYLESRTDNEEAFNISILGSARNLSYGYYYYYY